MLRVLGDLSDSDLDFPESPIPEVKGILGDTSHRTERDRQVSEPEFRPVRRATTQQSLLHNGQYDLFDHIEPRHPRRRRSSEVGSRLHPATGVSGDLRSSE